MAQPWRKYVTGGGRVLLLLPSLSVCLTPALEDMSSQDPAPATMPEYESVLDEGCCFPGETVSG